MKVKRIVGFVLVLAMLMTCVGVGATSAKSVSDSTVPTESYFEWIHNLNADGMLSVNLDEIFKTGETYKLSFNMKPTDIALSTTTTVSEIVKVSATGGKSVMDALIRLYGKQSVMHGIGAGNWNNIANMDAYAEGAKKYGYDVEMLWNTQRGTVDITFSVNCDNATYGKLTKKFTWTPGVIGEGEKYGNLVFTAGTKPVDIRNLSIKNINTPKESFKASTYTTGGSDDYMTVDLDDIFKTGGTYKISFNVKSTDATVMAPLQVTLGDGNTKSVGNGLVFLYDASEKKQ